MTPALESNVEDDLRHRCAALEQDAANRRQAEARTQVALTAARMGVWELDLATGRIDWSDSLAAIYGLSPAQAPTTRDGFAAVIHPDDRAAATAGLQQAITAGTDLVSEFRTIWPDGTVHWIAGRARLLGAGEDGPGRVVGVGMDIGERKSLEDQLRQSQKMEAIGQLAGGVAHDFNNLLTVIVGYAELLSASLPGDDPRVADVSEILNAADRAAALTRQLLTFSRKQVFQPALVEVKSLVTNTSAMLRRVIGEDIVLVTRLAPTPATVFADTGQIEQILMNLAVNARDAMPRGGHLLIETATVVLDAMYATQHAAVRPGSYVMLAVTDSGAGMSEETKQRMFEPFFTTKEHGRGTGLGLATVSGIVKQSGGYVWVYSEVGHGSTFKVYLPLVDGTALEHLPPVVSPSPTGTETVLVVEDEQAVRLLSRTLLEGAGYRVFDAAGPPQAEVLFREHADRIDLVLADVIMPGSSGPSLFSRLSDERPALKVLYMSGYTDNAIVQYAGLSPEIAFLQKPFTADRLLCRVREALDQ